jgi:hypothetical protein
MQHFREFRFIPRSTADVAFWVYYGMRLFVAGSFVFFLIDGDWEYAFYTFLIFLVMALPSFLKQRYRFYLPFELDLAVVAFVFLTLFLGSLNDFYVKYHWWDDMLHFQSGLLVGLLGFFLVYVLNSHHTSKLTMSPFFVAVFAFNFALAIGVLWEIYEFVVDLTLGYNMQEGGWPDTMGDLIANTIGALIVTSIGYVWMRRRQRVPFTPALLRELQYKGEGLPKK